MDQTHHINIGAGDVATIRLNGLPIITIKIDKSGDAQIDLFSDKDGYALVVGQRKPSS